MKILFVCNNAFTPGNGLSASAVNTIKKLREHGADARLMAAENPDPNGPQPDFPLKHFVFPLFEPVIRANGFCYAMPDRKVIKEAVAWADVVHFEEAFFLEKAVRREAVRQGKVCTGTFHLYPHNVVANLKLGRSRLINKLLLLHWKRIVFDYCSHIQCPTESVRTYLQKNGFKAKMHVISNGISLPKEPVVASAIEPGDPIDIISIGRLAREKSQDTLLDAMRYSRYADRIRLTFAGKGPLKKFYTRKASKLLKQNVLKYDITFAFYTRKELEDLARKAYLYVHCAWVEVEGLSCLEATREGTVPVIGTGELVGTSTFALCPESLYPNGDSRALAQRIDWWIEHPEERNRMAQLYADAARKYDIDKSIDSLIGMFRTAMEESK